MKESRIIELVQKYEDSLLEGRKIYLDADEFDELIEYYDSIDQYDKAKSILALALSMHPQNPFLILKKARIIAFESTHQNALDFLDSIYTEYDFDLYLFRIECELQLNCFDKAKILTEKVIEDSDIEKETIYSEVGFLYIEADQFEDGVYFLEKSIQYNPSNMEVLSDLAYAYEALGMIDKAIKTYNKILDIDPYSYSSWVGLGKLYSLNEDFTKAIDAFDFALTINNSDSEIIKLIAHCLFLIGRTDEAIGKFKEYIEIDSTDTSVYLSLADCYILKEMYNEAMNIIDECYDLDPEITKILVKKSYIYIQQGEFEKALSCINEGIDLDGTDPDLYMMKGELFLQTGDTDKAEYFFIKSLDKQNKQNLLLIEKLVYISLEKENYPGAIERLNQLLDADPNYPDARKKLILLYFEMGDTKNFELCLEKTSIEELNTFLLIFYSKEQVESFNSDRSILILRAKELIENRIYYKNSKN